ncbi:MAG: hypothetical protein U0936_00125 [Planctomycetaceae bacterium]
MSELTNELFSLVDCLTAAGIDYAVCGGLAVALHGYPRATRDIDLLIDRNSLESAKVAIESLGYIIPSGIIPFASGTPQAREVFRISRILNNELFTLDLLLVTPVLNDVWTSKEVLHLPDRKICVVSRTGLAKMKRLAGRLRDLADLEELGLLEEKP